MIRVTVCGDVVPVERIEAVCAAVGASVAELRGDVWGQRPPVALIIRDVARETGISVAEIVGPYREDRIVRARKAVAWLARAAGRRSPTVIGRAMGARDHSTIYNQLRRADELRDGRDPAFKRLTDRLLDVYRKAYA